MIVMSFKEVQHSFPLFLLAPHLYLEDTPIIRSIAVWLGESLDFELAKWPSPGALHLEPVTWLAVILLEVILIAAKASLVDGLHEDCFWPDSVPTMYPASSLLWVPWILLFPSLVFQPINKSVRPWELANKFPFCFS